VDGLLLRDALDARALAAAMRSLCGDRELCRRLGENAARTAEQYTWDRNGEQFREIFARILSHRDKSSAAAIRQES
jgi:glycosyltransferase involved in cell wall biosynthesis